MRSFRFPFYALLAAAFLSAAPLVARADDKAEIKSAYSKISAAMTAKDIKAVMALGTQDFSETQHGKVYSAKDATKMMAEEFSQMKTLNAKMTADDIAIKGKTATVKSSYTMKGQTVMPDGKTHTMSSTGTSRDTLVKTGKGWLFKHVEGLTEKTLMDGKPFDPSKMGGAPPQPSKTHKAKK